MPHPSKRKGTDYERELVNHARRCGLDAERAWGSDGKSLGLPSEVDLVVATVRLQAKRRKKFPKFLIDIGQADACVFRQDRGDSFVLIPWYNFLAILKEGGL